MDLSNKACVVTGATRGIGRAVAAAFAAAGADVVVSARTAEDVETVAAELDGAGAGSVLGIAADVSRPDECDRLIDKAVGGLGRLDVLVNNAGVGLFGSIEELSLEDWQTQIDTNLRGVFCCSKRAVPHLKESQGWIINIGSLASRNSFAGGAGYNASKFGLLGMTEAMMLDLRHSGIRVSIIMPGSVNTDFSDYEAGPERAWALGPDDVAAATLHLLSYPDRSLVSRVEMRPSRPPKR
jgi:NAD(P)-dependent dehydrogenase (short-subunit alcohol dehydrogenase family)